MLAIRYLPNYPRINPEATPSPLRLILLNCPDWLESPEVYQILCLSHRSRWDYKYALPCPANYFCVCVCTRVSGCVCVHACQGKHGPQPAWKVREQLLGVNSPFHLVETRFLFFLLLRCIHHASWPVRSQLTLLFLPPILKQKCWNYRWYLSSYMRSRIQKSTQVIRLS